jgi:hypothetical protein
MRRLNRQQTSNFISLMRCYAPRDMPCPAPDMYTSSFDKAGSLRKKFYKIKNFEQLSMRLIASMHGASDA